MSKRKIAPATDKKPKKAKKPKLRIIPLGGLEQIGLNITAFEYENSIIVVDCGLAFPTDEMPGIDLVIPDVSYLIANKQKVRGFVITHGHEDHIGALPYVLRELNVPVYGTLLTIALIEHKLEEAKLLDSAKLRVVNYGDTIKLGDFRVEFVKTNHSIPDACALAIYSPVGIIFHTGDFKIDYTPVLGESADLQRMGEIGSMGCLALMCDSTNATREGSTPSEKTVGHSFDVIFAEHADNRIIVASFASNVDRVQQIINCAYKFNRKVVIEGRSMITVINMASELGYIDIPENTIIDIAQLRNYKPEDTVIITTGSQGESMAALSRMAAGNHKKVTINQNDVVIMSSRPIPGNEKAVAKVVNDLYMKGANVILHDTHVSGHACEEDIKLIYQLLKPQYSIPVHGEYMHRVAQRELAETLGYSNENVVLINSGDVLEICSKSCKVVDHVEAGGILVDGLGVGDVGSAVLKDRQTLSQNGIIIVTLTVDSHTGEVLSGPEFISRGFIYVKEADDLIEETKELVMDRIQSCYDRDIDDWQKIKADIKDAVSSLMWKKFKRTPIILPVIMQVEI